MKNLLRSSALSLLLSATSASFAQVNVNVNPSSGCAPLLTNLTATVTNGDHYNWFFGDNTFQYTAPGSVNHTYTQSGTYYGYVDAFDINNVYLGGTGFQVQVMGVSDSLHTFNYNPCPGDVIDLDIWSNSNNYTVLLWDFGDGNTNNGNYGGIEHAYQLPGVYQPYAVVQTPCGIDTLYQVINVSNSGNFPGPQNLWFNAYRDTICPGDREVFNVMSWAYPNYVINFGDGNYSTTDNTHEYPNLGNYVASVTYTNGCGNSITLYDTVHVVNNHPVSYPPGISIYNDPSCINTNVSFYAYPEVYSSYSWNFGNGDTSSSRTPERMFNTTGNYPVTLTVTNGCGYSASVVDTVHIVNNIPVSGFTMQVLNDSICVGDAAAFFVNGNNNNQDVTYGWNFGDGNAGYGKNVSHVYTAPGTYTVYVDIVNNCGNYQLIYGTVYVGPGVQPRPSEYVFGPVPFQSQVVTQCMGDSVLFVFAPAGGGGTVSWDFGDASSGVAQKELFVDGMTYRYIKHAYQSTGTFTATCFFTNSCGNSFSSTKQVAISSSFSSIESDILLDQTVYPCQDKPLAFYSLGGSTYQWDFGDGTGSFITHATLSPVYHAFVNAGQYTVTCKVTNGCGYSVTDSLVVTIPPSKINITTNTVSSNCHMNDGKAIAVVSGGSLPYNYQWSNGNSTFLADSLTSGIYVVTVTDQHGCSNFSIATVSDQQAPVITVSSVIPVSCYGGNTGAIDINLIGNTAPYTYIWSNGATTQDVYQLVSGPYEVSVTDANGCVSTKSILVGQPPQVILSSNSSPASCGGMDGAGGVAVSGSTGPYSYIWPNGGNTPVEYGLGAGIYNVIVVDNNGCIYNTDVSINEANGPIIVQDSVTGTGCGNNLASVYIHTVNGVGPFTYSWSNGATTQNLMNVSVGNYTVTVTGSNGCKSLKAVSITKDDPAGASICIVSVDTITGKNKVIIMKDTSLTNVAGYNIYKESTMSGLYYLVGYIPFNTPVAFWTDSLSDSKVRSWRYKITVVDNCGGESEMSGEHKTIHLNTNAGINNSYNLIWDQYEGFNFNTYNIYRFDQANGWQFLASVPNNIISYTDLTPPANTLAYMVDAVPLSTCSDSTARYSNQNPLAAINSSHSNIKSLFATTGVNENTPFGPEFGLYPNPSSDIVNLIYPSSESGYKINILNALGQVVYSTVISAADARVDVNKRTIDLSGFAKGIYTVSFESKNVRVHKKLVLQ